MMMGSARVKAEGMRRLWSDRPLLAWITVEKRFAIVGFLGQLLYDLGSRVRCDKDTMILKTAVLSWASYDN